MSSKRPFAVVTDSTADLPEEWRARYAIEVVPLKVIFGGETFRDRVDMTDAQFFERLAAASKLPTTSAPSPGDFAEIFRRLSRDYESCISIHIGAQLSASAEAARVGAESVEGFRVEVVDSETVTMPMAFLCRVAAESPTLDEAVARVKERIPKCRVLALLDTLRYLEMGGRLGRAQAVIGTMLDLKPILLVKDREIKPVDRVRTKARAMTRMVEYFQSEGEVEYAGVMHAQSPKEADQIASKLRPGLGDQEIVMGQIGCVLGTHVGPKAVGIVYIKR